MISLNGGSKLNITISLENNHSNSNKEMLSVLKNNLEKSLISALNK